MSTKKIAFAGILAATYAVVTMATSSFAFGPIQFRVAEVLCLLCLFTPSAVWGVTMGCFAANLFSPLPLDILFGTMATLLGCLVTVRCKNIWIAPLPTILSNAVIIGLELAWAFSPDAFWQGALINGAQVAAGEIVVLYLLGVPLLHTLQKSGADEWLRKL